MLPPPVNFGGAHVIRWAVVDERLRHTGEFHQIVAGVLQGPAAGLALCKYDDEDGYFLFGCDADWNVVTDTWHMTVQDALAQAELEYEGVTAAWNVV